MTMNILEKANGKTLYVMDKMANQMIFKKLLRLTEFRKGEDRYSCRASIEEIEKNGYNLNISR